MTYISGQPIVFVGTGQTYADLKSLNAKVSEIINVEVWVETLFVC